MFKFSCMAAIHRQRAMTATRLFPALLQDAAELEAFYRKAYPSSDVDIFLHGRDERGVKSKVAAP